MIDLADIQELKGISALSTPIGDPDHHVTLATSSGRLYASLLRAGFPSRSFERNTIILDPQPAVLRTLPESAQESWRVFDATIHRQRAAWNMAATPTLKRFIRLYTEGSLLADRPIILAAHRFGIVPAIVVGKIDDRPLALFADRMGTVQDYGRRTMPEEEAAELAWMLNHFLPDLCLAYCEQIAFYFRAIFFGASTERSLAFCRRIRDIVVQSIRTKLRFLDAHASHTRLGDTIAHIRAQCGEEIAVANAVDKFAHLLVNYIYGFLCMNDRTASYARELMDATQPKGTRLQSDDTVAILQEAASNIADPSDAYLDRIVEIQEKADKWLSTLCTAASFVAEIRRGLEGRPIDRPAIFVTQHFSSIDQKRFSSLLTEYSSRVGEVVNIIHGRVLSRSLRQALLSMIWFADLQVLFLPSSWATVGGGLKELARAENWVVIELVYGQLVKRDLTIAVAQSDGNTVRDFKHLLSEYTLECEIPEATGPGWQEFAKASYDRLRDRLHDDRRVEVDLLRPYSTHVATRIIDDVISRACRNFVRAIFCAWRHFFSIDEWSVAQCLIELTAKHSYKRTRLSQTSLCSHISVRAAHDDRFAWMAACRTRGRQLSALAPKIESLAALAFRLGNVYYPIRSRKSNGRKFVEVDLRGFYEVVVSRGLCGSEAEFQEILRHLLVRRGE
jgi:hypothetical protein